MSYFKLKENNTSVNQEISAGLTTFLTMSYIIFVNPQILGLSGMPSGAVFTATILVTILACVLVALFSNYPIAIAPAMALNVYFTFVVVQALHYSWQEALTMVFISGVVFFLLTITKCRRLIIECIPHSLNMATSVGIGFFIALIALKSNGMIKADTNTLLTLGKLSSPHSLLFFLGFCLIIGLDYFHVRGAILISILSITLISIFLGFTSYDGLFALPPSIKPTFNAFQFKGIFNIDHISIIISFLLVALFDSTGTFIGLLQHKYFKKADQTSRISRALIAESIATMSGAVIGTSSTSPYIESASGIRAGGRTGLTSITVAACFLVCLFFSPLVKTIPIFATAPVLFYVASLMIRHISDIDFKDLSDAIPAIVTIIMIPSSFSIADGIGLGIITYVLVQLITKNKEKLNLMLILLAIIFATYFVIKPTL